MAVGPDFLVRIETPVDCLPVPRGVDGVVLVYISFPLPPISRVTLSQGSLCNEKDPPDLIRELLTDYLTKISSLTICSIALV